MQQKLPHTELPLLILRRDIMKRSEINKALKELEAMCEKYHCYLPPFCHFTPEEWESKGHEYDEVRECCHSR